MKLNFLAKGDIEEDIERIEILLHSNIFHPDNSENPLVESAFFELCIRLYDLLTKSRNRSKRVSFSDDVIIIPGQTEDITDLVSKIRNAVCYISKVPTTDRTIHQRPRFHIVYGKGEMKVFDYIVPSEYEDDVAFYYGTLRIYLNRQITRAFKQAKANLLPLL